MDVETMLSFAYTILTALQCSELKEIFSILGYQSELENLKRTVKTIKAVLLDAESKQLQAELSHQIQLFVNELKDVIYDADDLLDEFVTLAEQKKLMKGRNLSQKVCLPFSSFKSLAIVYKMARDVKKIRSKLDAIGHNHNIFGFKFEHQNFKLDGQSICQKREETFSSVYSHNIMGRDDDREQIISMLLDSNAQQHLSFLCIVGMGGLCKTTLAQLVYNNLRIKQAFPLMLWTCICDVECWDLKAIFSKILESAQRCKQENVSMECLQIELQEQLVGKRYLLVLDDVWNENLHQWRRLVEFLVCGNPNGSWVLVTTCSRITATNIGGESVHYLKGLSEEDLWRLFKRTTFGQEHERGNDESVELGLIKRCVNVPLAIRVVGSLLYGQSKEKGLSFQKVGLGGIKQGENGIEPTLKLSYYHLETPLRICFTYCALFPKDFVIKKLLISLWIAQGYVVPLDKYQSIEDAGEEYFMILLRRCFFKMYTKIKTVKLSRVKYMISCMTLHKK